MLPPPNLRLRQKSAIYQDGIRCKRPRMLEWLKEHTVVRAGQSVANRTCHFCPNWDMFHAKLTPLYGIDQLGSIRQLADSAGQFWLIVSSLTLFLRANGQFKHSIKPVIEQPEKVTQFAYVISVLQNRIWMHTNDAMKPLKCMSDCQALNGFGETKIWDIVSMLW